MFEFVEEALDEVALAVEFGIDRALDVAVALGGDVRPRDVFGNEFENSAGVVAAVGDHVAGQRQAFDQPRKGVSEAWPGVRTKRTGRPRASTTVWILVLSPPRERPMA